MKAQAVISPRKKFHIFDFLYKYGTLITIVLLVAFFGFSNDSFFTKDNILSILRAISIVTILAIGLTLSLSVGGFDLSIGSTASLSNALVISMFVWYGQSLGIGIIVGIVAAIVVGLLNAFLVTTFKVQDMLMTLAIMFVIEGLATTYTKGATISKGMIMSNGEYATGTIPAIFSAMGKLPWIIIIMLIIVVIVHIFLTYTKHGRYMYMIGGNPEAAELSGIAVKKYRYVAYILAALFAGIGGMILAARAGTAEISAGAPYLMDAVAAAFIGYSVLGAGKANALGTFVGAVLIGILSNGLVMLSVPYYSMSIVKGAVLALALGITYYKRKH